MEHRTTFTLDETSIRLLKDLARRWQVSQAEVVRRAIARAAAEASQERAALVQRLQSYQAQASLPPADAERYLNEVAEQRAEWGRG